MPTIYRTLSYSLLLFILTTLASAQVPPAEPVIANQNRTPAGKLENGILSVHLELRSCTWRPEAEDGPQLFVQAFGESGASAQIPGPLLRMPEGTTLHVTVTNKLTKKATLYGLNTRPGDPKAGVEVGAGETRELSFQTGAPGTYYYWARTTELFQGRFRIVEQPLLVDAQLNGAYIVDPVGAVPADRIFVLNSMVAPADVTHQTFELVTLNGRSYPFTEPLEYTEGETIRWRVINPGFGEHPMHLHGAFYQVLSLGDSESDQAFAGSERQWVVTQNVRAAHTMMMEWKPEHEGRWLFHCHFHLHITSAGHVPVVSRNAETAVEGDAHRHDDSMGGAMNDMAGLVLAIKVNPAAKSAPAVTATLPTRKIDLVIEPNAASAKGSTFSCSVREGNKLVASEDKSMGPPIVVTRGQPTEITVLNHLKGPTSIHWHGLELDSYYDGVIGGGTGSQVTPAVAPGASFTARFTPNRAGTFIYHTHAADSDQLSGGVYGALLVLEPGEVFNPEVDRLLVLGSRDPEFATVRMTLNGAEEPTTTVFNHGVKYRLRVINMAPNLAANLQLGNVDHPVKWLPISKDGAVLPVRLAATTDASLHIDSGETYDFEFQPEVAGEFPLQVENTVNKAKMMAKIVVR